MTTQPTTPAATLGECILAFLDTVLTAQEQKLTPLVGVGTCPDWGHCQPECTHEVGINDAKDKLRRVAADRKILNRHRPAQDWSWRAFGCQHKQAHGSRCAHDRHCWPCPDVTDLAEGYGWTEDAR
ncbi:hypothetical protein [Streptomyces sp. NBC_01422]|uniref:hypothetical protein n=1 Tax=Streptomyces sp. NBC_01422 TaxID=2903859 RepID=UPI002E28E5EE|nr:hypothetical protein [Streptomyces sp. NBC_01422]